MDKKVLVAVVIMAIVISGVLLYELTKDSKEPPTNVENVRGKYSLTISYWEDHAEIEYTDEDGKHSGKYFEPKMRSGLDWIRSNTTENATFLCWWDYGHMIKGYAERESVVRNPSEQILESVGDPSSVTEFDLHEKNSGCCHSINY